MVDSLRRSERRRTLLGMTMRARCSRPAAVLQLAFSIALFAVPTCLFGQGFSRVSVPVPVEIDGQQVHCPLYLKFEMKSYNIPFDQFAAGSLDKAQTMFVTAVQAIRKADAAKFASVWTSPSQMKGLGTTIITMVDDSPENWIKQARSLLDFDHLKVVAQVQIGSKTMFVWDSMVKDRTLRDAFYVGLDKNDRSRLSVVSSSTPVEVMVLSAFRAAQAEPDVYQPSPNIKPRYEYPIPIDGKAETGAHPVFLEFDGSPMDFPLGDEKVKAPTPLLESFRNASLAHQRGKNEVYASSFTPKSAAKVREWLASMESRRKLTKQAPQISSSLGSVKFLLNADPVFLVFEAPTPGNGWTSENLTYSYVLHEHSAYKIGNFAYLTELDDFLQNPKFFDKQFLKAAPTRPRIP